VTADFRHIRLELDFNDPAAKSFVGRAVYTLRAVRPHVDRLTLDAVDLYIDHVRSGAAGALTDVARFDHDGRRLTAYFAQPLSTESDTILSIDYRCVDPADGMIFAVPDAGYPDRPLIIHTQSETEFARYWFPCLDAPAERMTSETIVTVPSDLTVIGNGALVAREEAPARRAARQLPAFARDRAVRGAHRLLA
jgi:aminopeptidase N